MQNPFDELQAAVRLAREINSAAAAMANTLADLLEPNLQHLSSYRLQRLKKSLEHFNARTGKWKDQS